MLTMPTTRWTGRAETGAGDLGATKGGLMSGAVQRLGRGRTDRGRPTLPDDGSLSSDGDYTRRRRRWSWMVSGAAGCTTTDAAGRPAGVGI
ncbi:hypothetical protein ACLOJK_020734 [Asimina triloba]